MNEIIYLEADEEITSVIDRLRKAKSDSLALVIPRGGSLAQSIVNLKLLKKSANELGKEISLVSNDRISRNLASQIGLTVFSKASEAEKRKIVEEKKPEAIEPKGEFKVNSYYGKEDEELEDQDAEELEENTDSGEGIEEEAAEAADEAEIAQEEKSRSGVVEDEDDEEPVSDKIEKEEIKKSYKEPEDNRNEKLEMRNESSRPVAGSNSDFGSAKKEDAPKSEGGEMKKPMSRNKKIAIGIISACVVLLLAVAYIFLPYAQAKVIVKTENLDLTEKVTINPAATAIDREKLVIPATKVDLEKEVAKTYKTTGTKDLGEKAVGTLTFSNNAGVDDQVAAGTTIKSSGGVEFTLDQAITISKASLDAGGNKIAGKVTGKITAKNAGEKSNLPSTTLYSVTGKSLIIGSGETSGGTTKAINIVSDEDFKSAEADLTKNIIELGTTELASKAKDQNLEIIEAKITNELLSKESSKNLNDEADSFDYRMNIKLSVFAYNQNDLGTVLTSAAEQNLPDNKMLIGKDKFTLTTRYVGDSTAAGAVEVSGTLKGKTGQKISDKEIKDKIKNKKYAEARAIIEKYDNIDSAVIEIWPSSIARVPMLTSRIKVTFDYAE